MDKINSAFAKKKVEKYSNLPSNTECWAVGEDDLFELANEQNEIGRMKCTVLLNKIPFGQAMEDAKLFYIVIAAGVVGTLLLALTVCLCCRRYRHGHSYEPAIAQLVSNPNFARPAKEFYV
ncbi:Coxsackievirus and adenovirus receptor [Trichinella spiralis]|uniref:Coxsackievirus and adenovirus receptor n=1 Tax=Trichinella spiralis TaxID=6334 RepID=A0ABR3KX56_TRISP